MYDVENLTEVNPMQTKLLPIQEINVLAVIIVRSIFARIFGDSAVRLLRYPCPCLVGNNALHQRLGTQGKWYGYMTL